MTVEMLTNKLTYISLNVPDRPHFAILILFFLQMSINYSPFYRDRVSGVLPVWLCPVSCVLWLFGVSCARFLVDTNVINHTST